ncbi:MAG: hypothetical protein LBQ84_06090 [Flavobacteriaceae bacterium]|nr:hypothetical protein [Flavobacteriaceae bacterium]
MKIYNFKPIKPKLSFSRMNNLPSHNNIPDLTTWHGDVWVFIRESILQIFYSILAFLLFEIIKL